MILRACRFQNSNINSKINSLLSKTTHKTYFFKLVIPDLIYVVRLYSNYLHFKLFEKPRFKFLPSQLFS